MGRTPWDDFTEKNGPGVVAVFGGVRVGNDDRYRGMVSVLFPSRSVFAVESAQSFDTSEEAQSEYERTGRMLVKQYVRVLKEMCSDLMEGKLAPGSRVPICPLVDAFPFMTETDITVEEFTKKLMSMPPIILDDDDVP